tara:strand:+ start:261 stop:575 length:315 start_codon:yes stop_codon:yes gene_type:complete
MKLSNDYENLLKHVVDGFNRNYFRNKLKEDFKKISTWQHMLEELDPPNERARQSLIETCDYHINLSQTSIEKTEKGIIEYLTNQVEEAKELLIAIQSTSPLEQN